MGRHGRNGRSEPIGPGLSAAHAQQLPHLDRITFRQLLNHTSGLYSYTNDSEVQMESVRHPSRVWTVDELIGKNGEINGFSTTVMRLPDGTWMVAIANEGPGGLSKDLLFSAAEAWTGP